MDIVKQRRKRLMAWILAIGLCVGLWQGSAYAGEVLEEGSSVSGNNAAEEGVLLAEDTRTTSFPISYKDNDNGTQETLTKQYMINSTGESKDLTNGISISISSTADSITLTGKSEKDGKEYTHSLISWEVSASGQATSLIGEGNTISFNNYELNNEYNNMNVRWEKILVVKNGDKSEIYYESETQNPTIAIPSITELADAEVYSQGSFLSGWDVKQGETTIEENVTSYTFAFGNAELYTEISLEKKYENNNKVPRGGTFTLQSGTYVLGNSSEVWNVNSDGYEYSGGVNFYNSGETAYTFVKK